MIIKPAISFLNYDTDGQLIIDVGALITALTGNKSYLAPSPTLAAITAALNDFTAALSAAADGGVTLTAIKNAKRAALVSLIRALALYVQANCNNDLATLKSSGFPTQSPENQPVGEMPVPRGLAVALGISSGKLDVSVIPVAGASSYNWRVTTGVGVAAVVLVAQSTAADYTFAGLTPGQLYYAEASAVGAAGAGGWTAPMPQMMV